MAKEYVVNDGMLVPPDWVGGKKATVAEWGQREYESGKSVGWEQGVEAASNKILDCAADLFKKGKDQQAQNIRELAETIRKLKHGN